MDKRISKHGKMEDELADFSLYGEFVSSFHHWVSSEEQKSKVDELQSISRKKK